MADLFLSFWELTEPLGAICCSCAQLAGDSDLAILYGKEELGRDNPNPVKNIHVLRRFSAIEVQANAAESQDIE